MVAFQDACFIWDMEILVKIVYILHYRWFVPEVIWAWRVLIRAGRERQTTNPFFWWTDLGFIFARDGQSLGIATENDFLNRQQQIWVWISWGFYPVDGCERWMPTWVDLLKF